MVRGARRRVSAARRARGRSKCLLLLLLIGDDSHQRRTQPAACISELENVHEDIKLHVVTAYDGTVTAVPHVGEDGKMLDAGLSAPTTPPPAGRARLMRRASVNYGIQDLKKLEEIAKAAEKIHAESGSAGTEATDGDIGAAVAASNSRGRTFKRGFLRKLKKMHSLAERSLWKKRFFLVRDGFLLHYRGEKVSETAACCWKRSLWLLPWCSRSGPSPDWVASSRPYPHCEAGPGACLAEHAAQLAAAYRSVVVVLAWAGRYRAAGHAQTGEALLRNCSEEPHAAAPWIIRRRCPGMDGSLV